MYDYKGYAPPENGWAVERPIMEQYDAQGRLIFPESKENRIRLKRYLHEQEYWAPGSTFQKARGPEQTRLDKLMTSEGEDKAKKLFDKPKNADVLTRLFSSMTDEGDLILDFFAGSGSTGEAVWRLNHGSGQPSRSWVLVQLPEPPDTSENSGKNAVAAGYETIFEVTAERLRRAAKQLSVDEDSDQLGFRIFRTRPTNLVVEKPLISTQGTTSQGYFDEILSAASGTHVVKNAVPATVAWEVALKATGTGLDSEVITHDVGGVTTYEFCAVDAKEDAGRLLVSLGAFTLETADALKLSDDDTLILRGDEVEDSVTLTLAPRLQSKLILLERVPREVSL